ncbi:MAG: hypothetical protein R3B91_08795 [Planctomycetaceae bacterium]|nr:hypothetical protein [Planctomycetaceae bacterium]
MIKNEAEYGKAKQELRDLEEWLDRLDQGHPVHEKGLTKAGIRKMIARLHEELGEFEGTAEVETAKG